MASGSLAAAPAMRTPIESPILRRACNDLLNVIFPSSGLANCNADDITEFLSVVVLNRKASFSMGAQKLTPNTVLQAVDKLVIDAPFYIANRNREITLLRSYLLLLSEILRSFAQDVQKLKHEIHQRWYDGISALNQYAEEAMFDCDKKYQIDAWDTVFLLQYTQYLLTRIEDSYNLTDTLFERTKFMAMAALLTYNKSWEAISAYKGLIRKHRGAGPWHEAFLDFEQMVFIASEKDVQSGIVSISGATDLAHRTTIELVDILDSELRLPPASTLTSLGKQIKRTFSTLYGAISKRAMSAGPYETHNYYFVYGILNLLYSLSFRVAKETRPRCYAEMIGVIRRVLETTNDVPLQVYRKASDLYNYIVWTAERDNESYGKLEDLAAIAAWIKRNGGKSEEVEHSKL